MRAREKFDLINSSLGSGTTLIEASAGTGKTYAIAGIVLRLVLEEGLAINQILVTTYTELATAELRDRIRRLIRDALGAFANGKAPNDELIAPLLAQHRADEQAASRLRLALQGFDEAPIYTIHGFCQRMLKDQAFESGALFDAELVTDQDPILREIVDDFWRRHFYSSEPIVASFAFKNKLTPERLLKDIQELVNKPPLLVMPRFEQEVDDVTSAFVAAWERLRACWEERADEVRAIFANTYWAKRPYNDAETMADLLANLGHCLSQAGGTTEQLACIEKFATSQLLEGTRVRCRPPRHRLFDLCQDLLCAERLLLVRLKGAFLAWARTEMKRRKLEHNVLFFDDLLTRLNESLGAENGDRLARTIRERFPAALIDEFQDTDPVQYSIFCRIYEGRDARLFFIGDPKQAIYGFRGADVFTYIAASKTADHPFTLGKNWRSEAGLVHAINRLFDLRADSFVLEGIPFRPVEPAGKADETPLTIGRAKAPPFQFWLVTDETPVTNKEADERLPKSVAGEIARLLNGGAKLGSRAVEPRDIAVLVATNAEAQIVQDALRSRQIPSVIYSSANVFKSHEAAELARILAAVTEPAQEKLIRGALTTDALGLTGEGLDALSRDEQAWELRLLQFQEYHQLWQRRGFIQMLRRLVLEQGVRARLLRYFDGERRLTNMLHLAELLHRICLESRLGMTGLLKRLNEEIQTAEAAHREEYELRLEQDARAVRVATVHKSKGLEFGIVFCPFSWSGVTKVTKDRNVTFHEGDDLVLDLERTDANQQKQLQEILADRVRLLYVALTRAQHRCYFVWGNFKSGQQSAPAYLLGDWPSEGVEALSHEPVIALAKLPEGPVEALPATYTQVTSLQPRFFQRTLDRTYGIASFTRLISGHEEEPQSPDDDSVELLVEAAAPGIDQPTTGIHAFPRGTGPGTCLHHIFEKLDFTDPEAIPEIVRQRLGAFNIHQFDEIVCEMVRKTLSVPLELKRPDFTLSRISREQHLAELEFYFPINLLTHERLANLFQDNRLRFQPISGFMKGFIDLVFEDEGRFYIIDWKSNWLGPELADYSAAAMEAEMTRNFYHLQMNIYIVALHRFLRSRLPGYDYEKHFGGAFYIFLRGVEPTRPELGLHRARPDAHFIDRLSNLLDHGR